MTNTTRFMTGWMKVLTLLTAASLLLSIAPIVKTQAAVGASIEFIDAPQPSYPAGSDIPLKVLRGSTLAQEGRVFVELSSATGGTFSGGNLNGVCSGGNANPDITGNNSQKAFCYSNTNPGTDTITATFRHGSTTEMATLTIEIAESSDGGANGGSGAVWTNIGPCGSPQNVNQYKAGDEFYGHGSNFAPNTEYIWEVKRPGKNGKVEVTGAITTDENGSFCEFLFLVTPDFPGGEFQFQVNDVKNDNFRIIKDDSHAGVDIMITKLASSTKPEAGSPIEYLISVKNNSHESATGVFVTDDLPDGIDYLSSSITPDSVNPLVWQLGSLTGNATWEVVVYGMIASNVGAQTISNTATASSTSADSDLTNNSSTAIITPVSLDAGCTDIDAFNYDELAEVDDGSCVYEVTVNKVLVGKTEAQFTDFSFMIDGASTTAFNASGTATLLLKNGSYTISETDAPGFLVVYDNCAPLVVDGAPASCTITNRPESEPAPTCTVTVVSDTTDYVVEKDATAKALTFVHPGWTASIPGATWIWGDNPVVNPVTNETQTFRKQFGFVGNVTSAMLYVASDNMNSIDYNASYVGADGAENNFRIDTQDQYDVTSLVAQGNNELNIAVTNKGVAGSQPSGNPAGLLYKLVITGEVTTDGDCSVPYVPPQPEVDTYIIQGYVWHDDNRNEVWDGVDTDEQEELIENSLAGWIVHITNGEDEYSTTTDETGYYYFEVPAGTWTITETVEEGWERTTQESHEVTVPTVQANVRFWLFDLILPVAHAAIVDTVGDFNFGNDTIDTVVTPPTTTSGGGSRSSGGRPRVLGVTDTPQPTPLVLGEQVSVVPVGAPDTGRGGAAPQRGVTFTLAQLLLARREEE